MKYQMPVKVSGRLLATYGAANATVPAEFSGELIFPSGAGASFFCSFRTQLQQWAQISGSAGFVNVPDFVLPYYGCESAFEQNSLAFKVEGCSYHWESHPRRYAVREYSDGSPDAQETNMIRNFSDLVITGRRDESWGDIALKTQIVLDACLRSAREDGRLVTCEA